MTTGKTIALTRQNFVGKVMSLLFIFIFFRQGKFLPTFYYEKLTHINSDKTDKFIP